MVFGAAHQECDLALNFHESTNETALFITFKAEYNRQNSTTMLKSGLDLNPEWQELWRARLRLFRCSRSPLMAKMSLWHPFCWKDRFVDALQCLFWFGVVFQHQTGPQAAWSVYFWSESSTFKLLGPGFSPKNGYFLGRKQLAFFN